MRISMNSSREAAADLENSRRKAVGFAGDLVPPPRLFCCAINICLRYGRQGISVRLKACNDFYWECVFCLLLLLLGLAVAEGPFSHQPP